MKAVNAAGKTLDGIFITLPAKMRIAGRIRSSHHGAIEKNVCGEPLIKPSAAAAKNLSVRPESY